MNEGRVKNCLNIFRLVPKSLQEDIGFTAGEPKKTGLLSASTANQILTKLPKTMHEKALKQAKKEYWNSFIVDVLVLLMESGMDGEKALKELHKFRIVLIRLPMSRKMIADLESKYGTTIQKIIRQALTDPNFRLPKGLIFSG